MAEALQSEEKFGSALSLVRSAQRTATSLRERLSPDAWQVITEMAERLALQIDDDDGVFIAAELTLQELASFAGLAQENMNRAAGWRFLEMGRRAERAINTVRFARQFAYDEAGGEDLDMLLTWSIARSPIARAIWSVRCWRRCATSWCSIPIIPARSRSRSRRSTITSQPADPEGGRTDRAAAAARGGAAGDADDGGGGCAGHQDAVRAGAGSADARRRHRPALLPARTQCEPAGKADGPRVIYDIRHVTSYSYESPVSFSRCSLRLEPQSGDGQQLVSHTVEIRPKPADRTVRRDFFGTHTESIVIETAHRSLRIDSRSRVSVSRSAPAAHAPEPGMGDRPRRRL